MLKQLTAILLFISTISVAQDRGELELATWRDHLPYNEANSVTSGNGVIYCGTSGAVYAYDPPTYELTRMTTISGLSDIGVSKIKFSNATNTLIVAYQNGNIDLIKDERINNIPFIKNSSIIADKTINDIRIDGKFAYLSCGFGIVLLDVEEGLISNQYYIGENGAYLNVNDVELTDVFIYAATDEGVKRADRSSNLLDYRSWSFVKGLPLGVYNQVESFNGDILYNLRIDEYDADTLIRYDGTTISHMTEYYEKDIHSIDVHDGLLILSFNFSAISLDANYERVEIFFSYQQEAAPQPTQIIREGNYYWIADRKRGLVQFYNNWSAPSQLPNGPDNTETFDADIVKGECWVVRGSLNGNYQNNFKLPILNNYKDFTWSSYNVTSHPELIGKYDMVSVRMDPADNSRVFIASFGTGLFQLKDGEIVQVYDSTNTAEHALVPRDADGRYLVGGLAMDDQSNLWISNSNTIRALSVRTSNGFWNNFSLTGLTNEQIPVTDIIVDENGYKWIMQPRASSIIVFDDKGDPLNNDFRTKKLTPSEGFGSIPGDLLLSMAEDKNGDVWIGTSEGVAVFYSPSNLFDQTLDASRVFIEQDGQTQILLESETVTSIAIDGANRKWFGTANSGAYLMSADGTEEVLHFTTSNSPLFSDDIKKIAINHENGEVFFFTSNGIISYRGDATEGSEDFSNVTVFPNPVRENYSGQIAIKGLNDNSDVRITDINGALIYETKSFGGQAVWDGNNFDGRRASTGVYLVFASDETGEQTTVAKILFVH